MTEEDLVEAKRLLAKYSKESTCGYCSRTATKLATAADELRVAAPDALRFKDEHSDVGELGRLDRTIEDVRGVRKQREHLRDRIGEALKASDDLISQTSRPAPPAPPRLEFDPIVTPEDVGRRREAELKRFQETVPRRGGPIRQRIRFRIFEFTER